MRGGARGVLGIIDHFRDFLIGQDPAKIEHWWNEMVRGTFWSTGQVIMSAVAGIDMALWDLKGKRLGVPVYDLLGGPTRERVRVYRHLAGRTAEELIEDALRFKEQGFTALRYSPLAALDDHSIKTGTRRPPSSRRSAARSSCVSHSAMRSICSSTRTRCSARRRQPIWVTRWNRTASTSTKTRSGP